MDSVGSIKLPLGVLNAIEAINNKENYTAKISLKFGLCTTVDILLKDNNVMVLVEYLWEKVKTIFPNDAKNAIQQRDS
jgi:hypothetical protein